jgi:hypothetical protein
MINAIKASSRTSLLNLAGGLALAAGLTLGSNAFAAPFSVTAVGQGSVVGYVLPTSRLADYSGLTDSDALPVDYTSYFREISPLVIHSTLGGAVDQTSLAFCLDPFKDAPTGAAYNFGSMTLSSEVQSLIQYGTNLYNSDPNTTANDVELAAVQGAIWELTNANLVVIGANGLQTPLTDNDLALRVRALVDHQDFVHPTLTKIAVITPQEGGSQNLGLTSAVPEPETWALAMIGLFAVGASLRHRRGAGAQLA